VGLVVNAIAARDWATLATAVSPDIVYWRPGTGDRVDGAEAYVTAWRTFLESSQQLVYRPHTVLVDGDTAMVEATAEWRDSTAHPRRYSLVTVMRVGGGKLVEEREYIVPSTVEQASR
jgi:ketosteroid isomerase-like protein